MPRPARGSVEIVKRKDGLRTFWVRVTVDGRRHRVRLGTDRDGWTPAARRSSSRSSSRPSRRGRGRCPRRRPGDEGGPDVPRVRLEVA